PPPTPPPFPYTTLFRSAAFFSLHQALSALDRLEVRGRDSAGIELVVTGHGLDPSSGMLATALETRSSPLFTSGSVSMSPAGSLRSEEHTSELQSRENLV